jgi:hypothetical protein
MISQPLYRRLHSRNMQIKLTEACVIIQPAAVEAARQRCCASGCWLATAVCHVYVDFVHLSCRLAPNTRFYYLAMLCFRNGLKPTTLPYVVCSFVVQLKADVWCAAGRGMFEVIRIARRLLASCVPLICLHILVVCVASAPDYTAPRLTRTVPIT